MLKIRQTEFHWGRQTYIMGIINATPDSFSGDGLFNEAGWVEQAVAQGLRLVAEGAHILDVGGESTRPGAAEVAAEEELRRVIPVIRSLRQVTDVPISIDSYKAVVAAAALEAGADMVNDVWGLRMDADMAQVCAARQVPVILMHNRSNPRNAMQQARLGGSYVGTVYQDLLADIAAELQQSIDLAKSAGISDEQIMIDTGIGFGKTVAQNLTLLNNTAYFKALGYPILIGSSNKSFIGYTLDLPPDERMEGTAATVAIAIARGADMVRVHNVKAMSRVARMTDALVRGFN